MKSNGTAWRAPLVAVLLVVLPLEAVATTYYVRQTVGDDTHDGTSPETAWQHIGKLSAAMHAGDTAYVGPGLYREMITVLNDGAPDNRITFIGDATGQRSGDPPGVVMISGAEPIDLSAAAPEGAPGVYKVTLPLPILGLIEMDGNQARYGRVKSGKELPLPEGVSELDLIKQRPSSFYYDADARVLYLHTSDGRPPSAHAMERLDRGNGIGMWQRHYVTVMGFTFRHFVDAGIGFYQGSSDGIAINNTSYGGRQGIRVYGATKIAAYGNTLFRNENSGIYFALQSTNGLILGNTMYENIKGIRWSSQSNNGTAVDNAVFENHEYGISVENADHTLLRRNRMVNNEKGQLLVQQSDYSSDDNCFASGGPNQLISDFFFVDHYRALVDYQRGQHQDQGSREGGCGPLPAKVDVHKLDEEAKGYTDRARRILSGAEKSASEAPQSPPAESTEGGWLKWLFGR
ncbi:MAG: right-handed parallel beta-helix repeat-containing protein [Deltaproteobacteria bacterium]|nr:MAG: right-handed parallel beta-helix repeat-containing protein [Deltaproteobacteria bacterium]